MGNPIVPPIPGQPPGFVDVGKVGDQELDPKIFSQLWHLGADGVNLLPKWVVQIVVMLIKCIKLAIGIWVGLIDEFLSILADYFQAAQGNSNPAFYNLVASLITDLTGIEVSGPKIIGAFQSRGRLAAMQEVGGSLVDALTSEFAGVFQADKGGVFVTSRGSGIGGLPAIELSEAQGMNAARAFMGFALSFAVREGNTDFFAESLPFGIGHAFKNITEDLSKSIGLGRLTRLALKPIFQNLISTPMTWAFNRQYRPTLLGASEAVRAFNSDDFDEGDLADELARHGFTDDKQTALLALHTKQPQERDLFVLQMLGSLSADEHIKALKRTGYSDETAQQALQAEGLHLRRTLALEAAKQLVRPLLAGELDFFAYRAALDRLFLTAGEKGDLAGFATELLNHPRKRITFGQLTTAFIDGIVSIDDIAHHLTTEGYSQDDVAILLQIDLFKLKVSKDHAAAAAAKAAAKKKASGSTTPPAGG